MTYPSRSDSGSDLADGPHDDMQSFGSGSDRELEDEEARHEKTADFLLHKPEPMAAASVKKRDTKHDQKLQNFDNKFPSRHGPAEPQVVTNTKYVFMQEVKNTADICTQATPLKPEVREVQTVTYDLNFNAYNYVLGCLEAVAHIPENFKVIKAKNHDIMVKVGSFTFYDLKRNLTKARHLLEYHHFLCRNGHRDLIFPVMPLKSILALDQAPPFNTTIT